MIALTTTTANAIAALLGLALSCSSVRPQPAASFWCVAPGTPYRHVGGQVSRIPAGDGTVDVIVAEGHWRWVEIGGQLAAGQYETHLPLVRR